MKKVVLVMLCSLGFNFGARADFQIDVDWGRASSFEANGNGMVVPFGVHQIARKRVRMSRGNLRIGSSVITAGGSEGTVVGMNPSTQLITVRVRSTNYNYRLNDLAITNGCDGTFCHGEKVIITSGASGYIAGFFSDGRVVVLVRQTYYNYAPSALGMTDACTDLFCTGDTVITPNGSTGTVKAVFSDGLLGIQVRSTIYNYSADQLSLTDAVCANIYLNRVGVCY